MEHQASGNATPCHTVGVKPERRRTQAPTLIPGVHRRRLRHLDSLVLDLGRSALVFSPRSPVAHWWLLFPVIPADGGNRTTAFPTVRVSFIFVFFLVVTKTLVDNCSPAVSTVCLSACHGSEALGCIGLVHTPNIFGAQMSLHDGKSWTI